MIVKVNFSSLCKDIGIDENSLLDEIKSVLHGRIHCDETLSIEETERLMVIEEFLDNVESL